MKSLFILGTRGIPARHGGFETFAEHLSVHLAARGWNVHVYCQASGERNHRIREDRWRGVNLIHMPVRQDGPLGTILFDWRAILDAVGRCRRDASDSICLTLGYNTASFNAVFRLTGIANVINMDGIEWSRAKWGPLAKAWFWLNDRAGCWLGDHLVADHPEIKRHLATRVSTRKITTIAYGAERIGHASPMAVSTLGLRPGHYLTLIARPEPENSILEVVQGFSRRKRNMKLVVLGHYDRRYEYHAKVLDAASDEVLFAGAIYDKTVVQALRFHSVAYVHGHQVGGTNPSLVESLGASNAVIAHDNRFNRWVAGDSARYFTDAESFSATLEEIIGNPLALEAMRSGSLRRFEEDFTWPHIFCQYEKLLTRHARGSA